MEDPLRRAFQATRGALGCFLADGRPGRIVHVAAGATSGGFAAEAVIGGLGALARSTMREYGRRGIACNMVVARADTAERLGDAARSALFFACDASSFVNGEVIRVPASWPAE